MLSKLNQRQRNWLQTATGPETKAFIAKGPAEVTEQIDLPTRRTFFRAGLRGLVLGNEEFDSSEAAYTYAEAELAKLQADITLPVLDEAALGIDSRNATLNDQLEQATLRAETILHLGTMLSDYSAMPSTLTDFIDDLDSHVASNLANDMPWLSEMLQRWESDAGVPADEEREDFNTLVYRHACYGFLVKYATPVMHPYRLNGKWSGGSFSWGYYNTLWFYGETLEETVTKALAWAEECRQGEREKAEEEEAAKAAASRQPTQESQS